MIPLYHCRCCGFLSTLRSEFDRREGVLFDKGCIERAEAGVEPAATWLRDAIQAERSKGKPPRSTILQPAPTR